jgi:hypothetical protein
MADGFELAERVHRTYSDTVIRLGGPLSWGAVRSPSNCMHLSCIRVFLEASVM